MSTKTGLTDNSQGCYNSNMIAMNMLKLLDVDTGDPLRVMWRVFDPASASRPTIKGIFL